MALAAAESKELSYIDLSAFEHSSLSSEPFPYVIVPGFVPRRSVARRCAADYPQIDQPGSFPLADLELRAGLCRAIVANSRASAMRRAFAEKFALDLAGRPTMITVRGQARPSDGTHPCRQRDQAHHRAALHERGVGGAGRAAAAAAPAGRHGKHGRRGAARRRNAAGVPRHAPFLARPQAGQRRRAGWCSSTG